MARGLIRQLLGRTTLSPLMLPLNWPQTPATERDTTPRRAAVLETRAMLRAAGQLEPAMAQGARQARESEARVQVTAAAIQVRALGVPATALGLAREQGAARVREHFLVSLSRAKR